MPMIPFIGVRISCDMLARNSDFVRVAVSAASRGLSVDTTRWPVSAARAAEKAQREQAERTATQVLAALNRTYDRFAPTRLVVAPPGFPFAAAVAHDGGRDATGGTANHRSRGVSLPPGPRRSRCHPAPPQQTPLRSRLRQPAPATARRSVQATPSRCPAFAAFV